MKQLKYAVMAATLALLAACGQVTPQAELSQDDEVRTLDEALVDGDGLVPLNSNSVVNFGDICISKTADQDALIYLVRKGSIDVIGGGNNVYANQAEISVSPSGVTYSKGHENRGRVTVSTPANTIDLPRDWHKTSTAAGKGEGTQSKHVSSVVRFEALAAGTFEATVTYAATGTSSPGHQKDNQNRLTLTRDQGVTVRANVLAATHASCAAQNTAPTVPGKPSLLTGSNPNNTGTFTIGWDEATDAQGNTLTYDLESRNAAVADSPFSTVATGLTVNSRSLTNLAEGAWVYRVRASDGSLSSDFSAASDPIVVDKTAPTLGTMPADIVANATSTAGATVSYTAPTARDAVDPSPSVSCLQASGTTFAIGDTTVTCTATDAAGNVSEPGIFKITVNKLAQTINFTSTAPTNAVFGGAPYTVVATGGDSGNLVTFAAKQGSTCTISGSTVSMAGAGNCTIVASQAGGDHYAAADDVEQSFTIGKANASIMVTGGTFTYDGTAKAATGSATGADGSNLSSLLNLGNSFTNVPGGTANWSFSGDNNHNSANGSAQIVINKANQDISWSDPAAIAYGTALSSIQLNAVLTAGDGDLSYSPAAGTVLNAGTPTLRVDAAETANYKAAHQTVSITVNPWAFGGWQQPLVSLPTRNVVKAGRAIPVRFTLGSDYGLNIFNGSGPVSVSASCTAATTDSVDETLAASSSSLSYDASTGTYTYVWKTDTTWAGKCRTFNLNLRDGSTHQISFQFTK